MSRARGPETRRLVVVRRAILRETSTRITGSLGSRWWDLHLHCGHIAERAVTYRPIPRLQRTGTRVKSDVLPAPTRSRCDDCPRAT